MTPLRYHLWHPPPSRPDLPANDDLPQQAIAQRATHCEDGLDRHLANALTQNRL